jgi:arylsulfatase A-like enzyme
MLTDALTHYGYQCRLFYSGDHTHFLGLAKYYGLGAAEYHDGASVNSMRMNDDRIVIPWLKQARWNREQPTFIGIHLMSVHVIGDRQPAFERWSPSRISPSRLLAANPDPETYRNHYHNGILQADDEVRQIFEILQQKEVLDTALVIISADHGEYLGEFGRFAHGREPYEPVVRIPLLIYDQSGATYPSRALSSQVDIAPTFLYAIGAPIPSEWSGTPLQTVTDRRAIAVASSEVSGIVALSDGRPYKYWRRRQDGSESLFPLTGQSAEQINLAGDPRSAAILREMRDMYTRIDSQKNADSAP